MPTIFANNRKSAAITISCFGEVLWDYFAEGKRLGGAPLNVCLRLNAFDIKTEILSAVGADAFGDELLEALRERKIGVDFIAVDPIKQTSTVAVTLDERGSASYDIVADTAWDNIALRPGLVKQVKSSDVLVFGSLAGRSDISLMTLKKLLEVAKFSVFDVNLRKPHYHITTVVELMTAADCIKLNDEELDEIAAAMGSRYNSLEQNVAFISETTNTPIVCVTKGRHGALLKIGDRTYYNSGYAVAVVDTVGAGDSFLASLIYQLCCTDNAQYAIDFACAVGAMVAQNRGATPELSCDDIDRFMHPGKYQD